MTGTLLCIHITINVHQTVCFHLTLTHRYLYLIVRRSNFVYIIFIADIDNAISYILLYQRLPFSPVNDTCSLLSFYPRSRKQWIDSENILQRVISRRRFRQYATFVSYYFSPKLRICVARYQAAGHVLKGNQSNPLTRSQKIEELPCQT